MVNKYSAPASFYRKGQGEFQFSYKGPTWTDGDTRRVERQGVIIIEAAAAIKDTDRSDWDNKIRFGLGFNDFGQILANLRKSKNVDLLHKHPSTGAVSKLAIEKGREDRSGQPTYKLHLRGQQVGSKQDGFVNVFISTADLTSIVTLIEWATPRVLGWDG